jgi:hypothetical protein
LQVDQSAKASWRRIAGASRGRGALWGCRLAPALTAAATAGMASGLNACALFEARCEEGSRGVSRVCAF